MSVVRDAAGESSTPSSRLAEGLVGSSSAAPGERGVVAQRRFSAGDVLVVWGGTVVTRSQLDQRPTTDRRLAIQVDTDAYLVSEVEGPADWVNHSCRPNAALRGQISLVALRAIEPGEEICFDYATCDASDYDEFDCRCGTPECRGRFRATDWQRPDVQERLCGHFSPYIQCLIDGAEARRSTSRRRKAA